LQPRTIFLPAIEIKASHYRSLVLIVIEVYMLMQNSGSEL